MKYLQSSALILNRTSTAPTKKKVVETCVETKFLWLKVPFLLRGITKYFLQILSFYFLSVYRVLLIRWHEIILVLNFTPRMTFSKIEMMCQGAKIFHPVPPKIITWRHTGSKNDFLSNPSVYEFASRNRDLFARGGVWNNLCRRLRNFLCERVVDAESPARKTLLDIWQLKLRVLCDQCDNSYVDRTVLSWWEHTHVKLVGLLFIIHYFKYLRSLERYYLNSSL